MHGSVAMNAVQRRCTDMADYKKTQLEILSLQRLAESTNTPIWVGKQKGNNMAHRLTFSQNRQEMNVVGISDRESIDGKWVVIYRDNQNIIAENNDGSQRRIYQVREWVRSDQCRATRLE